MQDNIQVVVYKTFMYGNKSYKNALKFFFNSPNGERYPFYILPMDQDKYMCLQGQGHVRGSVINGIIEDFKLGQYDIKKVHAVPFSRLYAHYSALPDTIHREAGSI